MKILCAIVLLVAALAGCPQTVQAQGLIGGIVGMATGAAGDLLGARRFHHRPYVRREHHPAEHNAAENNPPVANNPSTANSDAIRAGAYLPATGVEFQTVPAGFNVDPNERYAVVNGHPVLVDPETRRVVEVLD